MRVTVRTYDDESKSNRFELEVAMTYKVERVKKEIEKFCGIPSCKQLLFYDGLQLEDGNSVEDYGLKNGPTILLVFNPAGFRIAIRSTWCGHSHGSTIQMDVDGTYTVSAIRKKYHSLIDSRRSMTLPPAQVYHKQMLLQDASTLQQCGITSESILEVYGVLYCRTITGKIITVRAKCSDVIEEIKTRIQDQEGIPPFQMTFSYAGRYMEDRRTLSDYKVTDRSTILLTFRLRGGATPSVCEMLLCCLAHVCSSVCLCSRRNGYMTLNSTEPNETSHQENHLNFPNDDPLYSRYTSADRRHIKIHVPRDQRSLNDDATRALYVHLPSGTNTTIEVSPSNTVLQLKKKIEMMDKNYLVSHQRLIYVGFCDDLPDESYIISDYIDLYCGGPYLTLKGKMISLRIQDSNQCGIVTVHLEYFDSVKRLKEEIHLEMNMRVPPDQQLLFFQHQQLEDNFTLSQCGIMDNSLIVLKASGPTRRQLMSELLTDKVASRYYEFAVHLGLDPHTVDVIQNDHFNKCHRCLIAVLNAYIHNYDVSWKTVCIALEHIELKNMAKQISSKYLYLEQ